MRVGIQGWGSEGDLRPLVALAGGLRRSGHEVRLVLTPVDGNDFSGLCRSLDIALRVVPERLDFTLDKVAEDAQSLDPLKVSRELVERAFVPFVDRLYESARELCASSDVLLWHYSCWYSKAAALKSGTPHAAVHFYPGLVPTRKRPPGGLPNLGVLNPLLWRAARWILDLQFRKRPAQHFSMHGLPPVRHVLPDALFSEHLNLHAFSPRVCPPAADWGPEHHVTGQFVMANTAEPWQPSTELAAFLERGDKPVLLSVGSMEHLAPQRSRELLVGAARAAKVRAIVQSKRSASQGADGDVYFLPWAPHDALLRHCSAMVHHGGAGTVHAALRAGVPSLALPFIIEQKAWADLLHQTGAGGRPIPFWKAKVGELARGIRELVTSEPLAKRARNVGEEMSREMGVATATRLLEQLLERSPQMGGASSPA